MDLKMSGRTGHLIKGVSSCFPYITRINDYDVIALTNVSLILSNLTEYKLISFILIIPPDLFSFIMLYVSSCLWYKPCPTYSYVI